MPKPRPFPELSYANPGQPALTRWFIRSVEGLSGRDRFAALYRLAGQAARRVETGEALEFVSKVFWFTMEFGVMAEHGETKAYGAGILSSYGEIEEFGGMDIRPLDLAAMGTMTYDITRYQDVLFQAESMDHLEDVVGGFWATCDDDTVAALTALTA